MKGCYTLIIFFLSSTCIAQSLTAKEIENDLVHEYLKLDALGYTHDYDSITFEDSIFRNRFFNYIQKYPFTLTYPFKKLKDSCYIGVVTSNDGLFRIYSWDTQSGGTMHFFNNIYQFKSGKNVYSKLLFDSSDDENGSATLSFFSNIYTLYGNEKAYYLGIDNFTLSSSDFAQSIRFFCIENNNLNDTIELIKTETGFQNQIFVEYDLSSSVNQSESSPKDIKYDSVKKIIYIPLVLENGKMTNKFIRYQFNGSYFQKISN